MIETLKVATEIEKKIAELEKAKLNIKERSDRKAESSANYDKAVAVTIIKLRNGQELELDGVRVVDPPATALEKIAKGICYKEKLEMDKAEAEYKSLITYIEVVESQLNGWQSINRHLSEK